MIYHVEHTTSYEYSEPAALSCNAVCLDLRTTERQRVLASEWEIEPEPSGVHHHVDFFGNRWRTLAFERPLRTLKLLVRHDVEVIGTEEIDIGSTQPAQFAPSVLRSAAGVHPYLYRSPFVDRDPEFAAYAAPSFSEDRPLRDCVMDLTRRIYADFTYAPDATKIGTTVHELFECRRGVCQDYAHFTLAVLRSLGVPARYVSGYLNTRPKPGRQKIYGADASHAWVSIYEPGSDAGRSDADAGVWIDFDPTNGVMAGEDYITIGWGRDYGDVTPLRGVVLGGGTQTLTVMVDVRGSK